MKKSHKDQNQTGFKEQIIAIALWLKENGFRTCLIAS